jgi:hypothetical protein
MTERGTIYQTTKARGGEGSQKKSHKDRYKEIRGTITAKQKKKHIYYFIRSFTQTFDVSLISSFKFIF